MTRNSILGVPLPIAATLLGGLFIVMVIAIAAGSGLLLPPAPDDPSPTPTTAALATPSANSDQPPTVPPEPTPTVQPSLSPEPTTSAEPIPTAGTSPPTSPTPSPSPAPSASPTTVPTPGPTAPAQSRFVEVSGFMGPGEYVAEITAGGPGFVAVGYADNETAECLYRQDGRIWTSANGRDWTRRGDGSLDHVRLSAVVNRDGTLFALGYVGSEECPSDLRVDRGNNVWRSTDGVTWQQITSGIAGHSPFDRWNDVTVAGDALVIVGALGEGGDEEERGGVWISSDGVAWTAASRPPGTYELVSVAAMASRVVAFGEDPAAGLAWYSGDGGATWQRGSVDSGLLPYSIDVTAGNGRFVAVTRACCELPSTTIGLALTSVDGVSWSGSPAYRYAGELALVIGSAFLALTESAETQLSADGLAWRSGPGGPPLNPESDFVAAAAAGTPGVVMVVNQRQSRQRVLRAWFAPSTNFDLADWTSPPEPAVQPVIGQSYQYELYTHCGEDGMRILIDGAVWLIDSIESVGRGFGNPSDRGTITMLSANEARYTSRRGGTILFERSASPPPWPRCA